MIANLRNSVAPRAQIELLTVASGIGRFTKQTFTIAEYTTGRQDPATIRHRFSVSETRGGWYLPDIFPDVRPDPDSRSLPPRSLVIAEDGTTWTTMWVAAGGAGKLVGVANDDSVVVSGRSTTFYPVDALESYLRRLGA